VTTSSPIDSLGSQSCGGILAEAGLAETSEHQPTTNNIGRSARIDIVARGDRSLFGMQASKLLLAAF
jgi:hypothetical protein